MSGKQTQNGGAFTRLKEKEKGLRKNIIIDAAEKLFASKPFHKVSMRDIAKEAGISASAIYRYFPDQKSLFLESFSRGTTQFKDELEGLISGNDDFTITMMADNYIEYFSRKDQYFRMMINFFLEGPVDAEMFEKLSDIERGLLNLFDELFIRMGIKNNVRFFSHSLFAALTGIVAIFRSTPDKSEEEILQHRRRIAGIIASLFTNSLPK